uniref:Cytochrome c biogenesis protein CcsA n=1 Tax=Chlorosarcinopsis eremi TaxID=332213 RepID=A0A5C2FRE6_9CHLO|nr:heme attachment to plastid cytochrome c [Chlorosarcinopsis eremi]AYQ94484.1 heme attachment to plastid cytochrome c [Chlorosarcinopsis eremi]QEP09227.1 chloroplast cytochrome c heme attachment protein [Chlorosarcinopsis eremi]
MSLQNDLANYSFFSLLVSMILYWASTLFGEELSSAPLALRARVAPMHAPVPSVHAPVQNPLGFEVQEAQVQEAQSKGLQNPTDPSKAIKNRRFFFFKKIKIWKKEVLLKRQKLSASYTPLRFAHRTSASELFFDKNTSVFNENSQKLKKEEAGLSKAYSPQNWFAIQNLARYGIIVSNILLGLLLILRWKESGHFPLSNLYESLMFLSWCFTGLYLFIDFGSDLRDASLYQKPTRAEGQKDKNDKNIRFSRLSLSKNTRQLLGAITTPSALLTNAFATFTLPKEMQEATPLVPALQSNWLMMHVTVMVLSYAALILGSLLSIAFLIVTAFAGGKESEGKEAKLKEYQNTTALLKKPVLALPCASCTPEGTGACIGASEARFFAFSPLRPALALLALQNPLGFEPKGALLAPLVHASVHAPKGLVQAYDFQKLTVLLNIASVKKTASSHFLKAFSWQGEDIKQKQKQFAFSVQAAYALPCAKRKGASQNWNISPRFSLLAITLDNLSYRILGIGFPLLTIGILSGAVWANEAWGSYWSWDPKETWALLTWLIFAIYLHTRLSKGWEGKKPAIIASLGFVIVWICYLGVNLLGEGLHSYGWISST